MSPYNAYSSSLSSSRASSYTPSSKYSSSGYSSLSSSSSYSYKPPTYSSSLASKYRSPSSTYSYSSPSSYISSTLPRTASSSYLSDRAPKFTSVSSYTSAISGHSSSTSSSVSDYKYKTYDLASERLYRSPSISLSRRNSSVSLSSVSLTPDRSPRPSLPNYSSILEDPPVRYRNTSSKWSSSTDDDDDDKVGIRVGLNNLGNTCFMNAVLQCLCHTPPLVEYCTRGTYLGDINHGSPTRGDLMKVFAEFVKKLSESKDRSAISPHNLRREVRRYAPRFSGDNQQDSQEFLRYLLQGLHDDINRVKYRRNSVITNDFGGDSLGSWKRYKNTDDSLIVDVFGGQLKSSLKCTICNNESITYDPFWDLSLPLPEGSRNVTLRKCFELFSAPEFLEGPNAPFCEKCKKKTRSSKKMEVNRFPQILVIHLKRFSAASYGQKLNTMVDCPMTLSNFADVAAQSTLGDTCSYALYGVVDHDGSYNSGHYTAKCRNPITKEWCEFNDTRVSRATANIVTYKAYILFYIKDNIRW